MLMPSGPLALREVWEMVWVELSRVPSPVGGTMLGMLIGLFMFGLAMRVFIRVMRGVGSFDESSPTDIIRRAERRRSG